MATACCARGTGGEAMSVSDAIEKELAELPDELANSALAAVALSLGRELDSSGNSATSKSMNARVLFDVLLKLRDLAPKEEAKDDLDELAERRRRRLAYRSAAAEDLPGS